jgi:hypothetical protein
MWKNFFGVRCDVLGVKKIECHNQCEVKIFCVATLFFLWFLSKVTDIYRYLPSHFTNLVMF